MVHWLPLFFLMSCSPSGRFNCQIMAYSRADDACRAQAVADAMSEHFTILFQSTSTSPACVDDIKACDGNPWEPVKCKLKETPAAYETEPLK